MISFPNAKINLGLNILSKRADGFHNISSCFYPVGWCDVLEIIPADKLQFSSSGIDIPGDAEDNLCLKAYKLLKRNFDIPPVHIHLHKIIPIGAGLGGGSSDCAFTFKLLNELFDLELSNISLENYASQLGSDCPFFIRNQPVLVSGTGNEFSEVSLDLSEKHIIIVYPNIHVSTKEAYAGINPANPSLAIEEILNRNPRDWHEPLVNDFENSVIPNHPEINEVKNLLYDKGALYSSMTGSGSAVYGIFNEESQIQELADHFSDYPCWSGIL
ncbi:MAG: 4-(cytidine 5'-diphospho)-2-C-methyl-D-erythritol kinase [Cyclobacteriaceae bacterium]